ncbi:exonuclease of the beta-lactamase fold [Cenarchaeum symbiosum A]|uniref:Exonuclease of the beta-lactamase fold n=1 Tax=Cenarchaeum symbiosum (strain A) TaxID=414004 RepID=A0RTU6_CENSY|nr:exonuclease of the beta-lactamase fold [Cenarchaeum symbiosum A]
MCVIPAVYINYTSGGACLTSVNTNSIRMTDNGISCELNGQKIYMDPKRAAADALNFLSHGHTDHLPSGGTGRLLASKETARIASLRGTKMENHVDGMDGLEMIDAGHILGARGLLADGVFYTGDICTRERGFLPGARVPKCEVLITECTFGLPEFSLPSLDEVKVETNRIISEAYSSGRPVILMGYQLGKAQTLSHLFGHWDPLYYHDSVKKMNDLHREMGVPLRDVPGHSEVESEGLLDKGPWVMVAPMMTDRNAFVRRMRIKYNAVMVSFSGWARSPRFSFGQRGDHSVPLSDHCDYNELVKMVEDSGAKTVYTIHGFTDEFAADLCKLGYDARPLRAQSLDCFV